MSKSETTGCSAGGVKIKRVNFFVILIVAFVCLFVFATAYLLMNRYKTITESMNDYAECEKAVLNFKDASDYLTNQAVLFAAVHDKKYMENYCFEYENVCRRETALQVIEMTHKEDTVDLSLLLAFKESMSLSIDELYVIRVVAYASGIPKEELPDAVAKVEISYNDMSIPKSELLKKYKNYFYSDAYVASKQRIGTYVSSARSALANDFISLEYTTESVIKNLMVRLRVFVFVFFFISLSLFFVLLLWIFNPLYEYVKQIERGEKIKSRGSYEMQVIANAYNSLCEKNAVVASTLKHKAEHDPLTGLINRTAFDAIQEALRDSSEPVAYLIVDIDFFKKINDEYGHLIGDKVLVKIAKMLQEQFRVTDYVARVGGDEFAIIMTKFCDSAESIIANKIENINLKLQTIEGELPSVSLSVGVAFSRNGYDDNLVKKADKALYRVKKSGRCNYSFYSDFEEK